MTTCPRCESQDASVVSRSPVEGAWEIYMCPTCLFTWRSTEPSSITDPKQFNSSFKVDPADIPNAIVVPQIPERRNA